MDVPHQACLLMAGGRGVEPHPVSENLVFKASRRTNPAALPPKPAYDYAEYVLMPYSH